MYICSRSFYRRVHSSAGSEHLPYKQGVTGSNPVEPTLLSKTTTKQVVVFFFNIDVYS